MMQSVRSYSVVQGGVSHSMVPFVVDEAQHGSTRTAVVLARSNLDVHKKV